MIVRITDLPRTVPCVRVSCSHPLVALRARALEKCGFRMPRRGKHAKDSSRAADTQDGLNVPASLVPEFGRHLDAAIAVSHFRRYLLPPQGRPRVTRVDATPSDWTTTALLWWCIWNKHWTFLHIAKTGGTAIELADPSAPQLRLKSLFALRHRNGPPLMTLNNGPCTWWPRVHDSAARSPNVVHLTPALWGKCFGEEWQPYFQGSTYCVMRDPVERFISEFLFARLHWFWPSRQCKMKHPWDKRKGQLVKEMWCFARLTERMIGSFTEQQASTNGLLNVTELLTHLLPQHLYISDDQGRATCDVVFSYNDVQAARLLQANHINHLREKGGAMRVFLRSYVYDNSSLLSVLQRTYGRDFELWERVRKHQRPTEQHLSSLQEHKVALFQRLPNLPKREPSCSAASCDCPACCTSSYNMSEALSRYGCISCVLSHQECGGFGRLQPWRLPRTMGALCGSGDDGISCNTCDACCEAPWVEVGGAS